MKRTIPLALVTLVLAGPVCAADLEDNRVTYEKHLETIILHHGMQMTDLGQQYTKALGSLLDNAKREGDLEKTRAIMDELESFGSDKSIGENPAGLLDIRNLQLSYTKQASLYHADKANKVIALTSQYDRALEQLQRNYVRSSALDEAAAVQAERKRVESSPPVVGANNTIQQYANSEPHPIQTTLPEKSTGEISLDAAMDLFALNEKGWVIEDGCLAGMAGPTQRFYSTQPVTGTTLSFGFKIKAKWYHGLAIKIDGAEYWFSRGHLLNKKTAICVDDEATWRDGKVDKPDEFVPMEARIDRHNVAWYYDNKLITKTKLPRSSSGKRTVAVGFSCHSTKVRITDFFLTKSD